MSTINRIFILIIGSQGLTACDTASNVEFKGDRLISTKAVIAKTVAQTNGGVFSRSTASGYNVQLSFGAPANFIRRQTTSGQNVELNIVGQVGP